MESVTVIEADLSDPAHARAVLDLLDEFARDPIADGAPLPPRVRATLIEGLRNHPTTRVFLARRGESYIGIAVCFTGFSTFRARPLINIHDIAVSPAWRGKGVGRALMQAVEDYARRQGCCSVTLEVKDANHAARRAYLAFGFHEGEPGDDAQRFLTKRLT